MTEDVTVVKLDTQEAQTSVKELRKELKGLKDQMAGLEEGSEEFLSLAQAAGELKHQIDEINESVAGASADLGDMLGNATKATTGIIGGFQAAKGALTLFGVESEEVTKSIQKMQASMSIIQGLSSIDQGVKALAKLRGAITGASTAAKIFRAALTPKSILAVTAVVTGLITVFQKLANKQKEAAEAAQARFEQEVKNNEALIKSYANVANEIQKLSDNNMNSLKASYGLAQYQFEKMAKNTYGMTDAQIKYFKGYMESYYESLRAAAEATDEYAARDAQIQASSMKSLIDKQIAGRADLQAAYESMYDLYYKMNELEKANKNNKEIVVTPTKVDNTKTEKNTYFEDAYAKLEYQAAVDKQYGASIKYLQDWLALQQEEQATLKEASADWYELGVKIEDTKQKIADFGKKEKDETDNVETVTEKELSAEDKELQSMLIRYAIIEESYGVHLKTMQDKLDEGLRKNLITEETYAKASKKLAKQKAQYQVACIAQAANGVADILNSIADMQDENDKEGFERSKKLQIASATIQMLTGIATAISGAFTTKTGPWDIALAAIQAATIAASAGAQINAIAKQTWNGGSSGETGATAASSSAISTTIIPPVEYSSAIQGAMTEEAFSNARYYVSVTEFDRVQERVNVAETESRY